MAHGDAAARWRTASPWRRARERKEQRVRVRARLLLQRGAALLVPHHRHGALLQAAGAAGRAALLRLRHALYALLQPAHLGRHCASKRLGRS